jgi:hypothetical protein
MTGFSREVDAKLRGFPNPGDVDQQRRGSHKNFKVQGNVFRDINYLDLYGQRQIGWVLWCLLSDAAK